MEQSVWHETPIDGCQRGVVINKMKQREIGLHRKNSKLGYTEQFLTGKYSTSNDLFADKIDFFVRAFESVCNKLETTIERQNAKILQLESNLVDTLVTRFDSLIHINQKVYDTLERKSVLFAGREHAEKTQTINANLLFEPRGDSGTCKNTGSLKQSIMSLNKNQQTKNVVAALPPLPSLDRSLGPGSPKLSKKLKENFQERERQTDNLIKIIPPDHTKSTQKLIDLAVVALVPTISVDQQKSEFDRSVGSFYNNTAATYFDLYSSNKISYEDMKIKFSYDIINEALSLSHKWFEFCKSRIDVGQDKLLLRRAEFYHMHNEASKSCLQFLISKYPPSRRRKIDTELSQKIKNSNKKFSIVKYDMLSNANVDIGLDDKQVDFAKDIKIWLNTLIKETKKQFPRFKEKMKDIFINVDYSVEGSKGMESELEFVIGTKISEGTSLFTEEELNAPGLQIKSTELLRILMKWCEELSSYFVKPEEKIYGNSSGFKTVKSGILPIKIPKSRLDELVANLKDIYESEVVEALKIEDSNIGYLVTDLIIMTLDGVNDYEFLNQREISIAKLSDYMNESLKAHVMKFLNLILSQLVKIRSRYQDQRLESKIHLVTFGVMDLLRCRCVGSKSQIYRIYKRILQNSEYFEIIRVKNKLNEPTRDIIINLKIKQSFLICEVQLSLGEAQEEVNDHFCHFLYELERTNFGVLFECASQICNLDPRMQYIELHKDISFKGTPQKKALLVQNVKASDNGLTCQIGHLQTPMKFQNNDRPFCCTMCTKFKSGYSLCLNYLRCPICGTSICPECVIMISKNYSEFIEKYTSNGSDFKNLMRFFYPKHLYEEVGNSKATQHKIPGLLQKYPYILHMVVDNVGHKPVMYKRYKNTFIEAFSTLKGVTKPVHATFCWNYLIALKPCERKTLQDLKNYRKFNVNREWSQLQEILKENQIIEVMAVIDQQSKLALIVDIIENQDQIQNCLLRREVQKTIWQTNRLQSNFLELTSKKLPDIELLDTIENKKDIQILNLWENKIRNIDLLDKFTGVTEVYIRDNQVESMAAILGMRELEIAFICNNKIKGALPVMKFPSLTAMDISLNEFSDMGNMAKSDLRSLVFFRMVNTKIKEIPLMNLPRLEIFWFDHNDISDISNLFRSSIPELTKVSGNHNLIQGELPELNFPKLEYLILNSNQLSSIQKLSKSNCPNLKNMALHHNSITGPLPTMQLPSLVKLDLSFNKISSLPTGIFLNSRLSSLQSLDLRCNQITGQLPIIELKSLRRADLSNNLITNIQRLDSCKLPALQVLDISKNMIKGQLPALNFFRLKRLILSSNQITDISNLSDSKMPKLIIIKLDNNKISSPIPKMSLEILKTIDLSHNSIPSQEFVQYIHLLPSLETVFLFDNPPALKGSIGSTENLEAFKFLNFSQPLGE